MSDDQAGTNVEAVIRAILDGAKQFRERAATALTDGRLTEAEFNEVVKLIDELVDEKAKWWRTGEGPPP
jgi:alpha-galactosidase/6-phospho-beta-glucosidase family protein